MSQTDLYQARLLGLLQDQEETIRAINKFLDVGGSKWVPGSVFAVIPVVPMNISTDSR